MSTSENKPDKIIVGNCIHCDGLVRIPVSASPQSTVRCPHCSESFKLASVLDDSIPALEVVEEPARSDASRRINLDSSNQNPDREPGTKFEVSPILKKGAKKKRKKRRRSRESEPQKDGVASSWSQNSGQTAEPGEGDDRSSGNGSASTSGWAGKSDGTDSERTTPLIRESESDRDQEPSRRHRSRTDSERSRSSREPSTRKKKRKKSDRGGFEIIKVVVGAMLALPVAQLLVWWVFGQDPLDLGPKVGAVVPAVVPADLRGDDAFSDDDFENGDESGDEDDERVPGQLPRPRNITNLDRSDADDD